MDFERARQNMIEQQIRTWDVLDRDVLDLLSVVRREEFVPPEHRALAFSDLEIPLAPDAATNGRLMFAPKLEARLLQELAPRRHESVLEIGAGSGHMAALLSHRARDVLTVEIDEALARFAAANLARAGASNVRVEHGNGLDFVRGARFDVIVLSGSVPFVPQPLIDALDPGGRLVAIVGQAPAMKARLVTRAATGPAFASVDLFETVVPPLQGFPQPSGFRF